MILYDAAKFHDFLANVVHEAFQRVTLTDHEDAQARVLLFFQKMLRVERLELSHRVTQSLALRRGRAAHTENPITSASAYAAIGDHALFTTSFCPGWYARRMGESGIRYARDMGAAAYERAASLYRISGIPQLVPNVEPLAMHFSALSMALGRELETQRMDPTDRYISHLLEQLCENEHVQVDPQKQLASWQQFLVLGNTIDE